MSTTAQISLDTDSSPIELETDVLVVGSGPAGGTAALALATYGVDHVVITKYRWTANSPRAHITNQGAMEVFRDLGIEEEIKALAVPHEMMGETVFCTSMAGEEIGRLWGFGAGPKRSADYALASPTEMCDIPQSLLEPVILGAAASRGSRIRFETEYLGLVQEPDSVLVSVRDRATDRQYRIRAKYVLGADGANSAVARDIDLPFEGQMGIAGSMNIIFQADLRDYAEYRPGSLYWMLRHNELLGRMSIGAIRMVRQWDEWILIWSYDITKPRPELDDDAATRIVHELVGAEVPVKIRQIAYWGQNQMYATRYDSGRVFCMGDAVHRHPPSNGLGSNTSVQDAYNIAWKLAHVLKGQAGEALLDSYSEERAPIGRQIVTRANRSILDYLPLMDSMDLLGETDPAIIHDNIASLVDDTPEGASKRERLVKALEAKNYEFNTHGVELGQRYVSAAIRGDGTPEPEPVRDPELYYHPTTWPGARLPHVWLGDQGRKVSTVDLVGHGRWALLTGISGGVIWTEAAERASQELGVDLVCHIIGPGQQYTDLYGDWARLREVAEDGYVLVRPDGHVACRSSTGAGEAGEALTRTLRHVLSMPLN